MAGIANLESKPGDFIRGFPLSADQAEFPTEGSEKGFPLSTEKLEFPLEGNGAGFPGSGESLEFGGGLEM